MELAQLRTLRMVAETLNFTRAAERLGLTQSAVSHQIKTLEAELGEPLFLRVKRGVRLSEAGKQVLEHATRVLDEVAALGDRLAGPGQPLAGRVRAGAATQAFVYLFGGLFESFMKEHPQVELSFRTTVSTDQTVADILNGAVDVGFAALPVFSPALAVSELFEDELLLVVSPRHPLSARREVSPRELAGERVILFERGSSIRRATDQFFRLVHLQPALALETNDTYFVKLMVERGLGVSLLPAWAIREEVASGRLSRLGLSGHRLIRSVSILSLARSTASATRAFVEFVLRHRAELQALARGDAEAPSA